MHIKHMCAFSLLTALATASGVSAHTPYNQEHRSSLKVRSGAFFHTPQKFRKIYGVAGGCVEVEGAYATHANFEAFGNLDYFIRQKGHSVGLKNPTDVQSFNFSFGVKVPYEVSRHIELYLGVGPSVGGIWIKNDSICGIEKVSQAIIGGVFKSGIYCNIDSRWFVDFFGDYLYQPTKFSTFADVGGFRLGAGFGGRF
ncbi:MAG: hypothetical protein WCE21_01045 [Candidatus Babeliales bacterium]